jgi:hypothetical protein
MKVSLFRHGKGTCVEGTAPTVEPVATFYITNRVQSDIPMQGVIIKLA